MARKSKKRRLNELKKETRVFFASANPQNTIAGLIDLCGDIVEKKGKNITLVEIGSFAGVSTEVFALNFKNVIAIDAWDIAWKNGCKEIPLEHLEEAEKRFDLMIENYSNIKKIKATSLDAVKEIESSDVVYIDASHKYNDVVNDIKVWKEKLNPGGIICGHDYTNIFGVRRAVNDVLEKPDKIYEDCSWIKQL